MKWFEWEAWSVWNFHYLEISWCKNFSLVHHMTTGLAGADVNIKAYFQPLRIYVRNIQFKKKGVLVLEQTETHSFCGCHSHQPLWSINL